MWAMVACIVGVGLSAAALATAAAMKPHHTDIVYLHMAIAAAVSTLVALAAVYDSHKAAEKHAGRELLASTNLRYLGLVWAWGALVLFVTYAFVLHWREWWHFVLACSLLAALCLGLAGTLRREAKTGSSDDTLLRLARILSVVHLGAMLVTVVGLLLDGKMVRFLNPRHQDWAAQNIFFFGALAMAAISWNALATLRSQQE